MNDPRRQASCDHKQPAITRPAWDLGWSHYLPAVAQVGELTGVMTQAL